MTKKQSTSANDFENTFKENPERYKNTLLLINTTGI